MQNKITQKKSRDMSITHAANIEDTYSWDTFYFYSVINITAEKIIIATYKRPIRPNVIRSNILVI
jgi:hypothetical protein